MGADPHEKERQGSWRKAHSERAETRPDPLRDVLQVVIGFILEHRAEHPTDPPPVFSLSPYQEAWTATVSDKAYRRSVSGFGPTPGAALEQLEARLVKHELPWKQWDQKGT